MAKRFKISFSVVLALVLLLSLAPVAFGAVTYSIDNFSLFQSDSNVVGSGSSVCSGVDITGVIASCDTNLSQNTIYRFDVNVSNSGSTHSNPTSFLFQNVYAASDVIGSDANVSFCGCLDDGILKAGTPSLVGDDLNCALPLADSCLIEKLGGFETFYFVIGVGSDASSDSGTFLINEDAVDNDSSAEISFNFCVSACDSNIGCDDGNSLTTDICSNPGTCSSSCASTACDITCNSDEVCDDSDDLTTDTCTNPGTCASACSNVACSVACDTNSACNDSNSLTTDICSNPGLCTASCANTLCDFACTTDAECDDSNSTSLDTCSNPSTCSAVCSYASCTPDCVSNLGCDDSDLTTIDTCVDSGTCDAYCSNDVCTPVCNNDADCGDGDPGSVDTCIHPGGCGAHCINEFCTPVCSADSDCDDSDPATSDSCLSPGSCTASCSNETCAIVCSTDSDCDDSDGTTVDSCSSAGTCDSVCENVAKTDLSIEVVVGTDLSLGRGQAVDLNFIVKNLAGEFVEDALITLTDSEGNEIELVSLGEGLYTGTYNVPVDFVLGEQKIALLASSGGLVGADEISLEILPGSVNAVLVESEFLSVMSGEKKEFKLSFVYGDGSDANATEVTASLNGVNIPLTQTGNIFAGNYLFSDTDIGTAVLLVSAADSLGNTGETSIEFSVASPIPWLQILGVLALIVAILVTLYGLKKTHKLSKLLHKMGTTSLSLRTSMLQSAISKEKKKRESLAKRIKQQEKTLEKVKTDIELERKKQAMAMQRLPTESRYAAEETAAGAVSSIKNVLGQKKSAEQLEFDKRIVEIDSKSVELKKKIKDLEESFDKKTVEEKPFKQKQFDLKEKLHLLELEKKKIS